MNIKLNFSISEAAQRTEWLNSYVGEFPVTHKFTNDELEMMGNYLLWGKSSDGQNEVQRKNVRIETRSKTWDGREDESLEGLMEQPGFSEANLSRFIAPPKRQRVKFSRTQALAEAPEYARAQYVNLFKEIDETDFMVEQWELNHGKRTKEIRQSLIDAITEETRGVLSERARHFNQYQYLKLKHLLVELRRQQFFIKDSYTSTVQRDRVISSVAPPPTFGEDIKVLPLGFCGDQPVDQLIWRLREDLNPFKFTEDELAIISKRIYSEVGEGIEFDWRNTDHVYQFILAYGDLIDGAAEEDNLGTLGEMVRTLHFYIEFADLTEIHREILARKLKKDKNVNIARDINQKYGKSYSNNYISTLFTKKIIPEICAGAAEHFEILKNLAFEEEWKKCSCCGTWLLRNGDNFTRRARSRDGFAPLCKKCDRKKKKGEL